MLTTNLAISLYLPDLAVNIASSSSYSFFPFPVLAPLNRRTDLFSFLEPNDLLIDKSKFHKICQSTDGFRGCETVGRVSRSFLTSQNIYQTEISDSICPVVRIQTKRLKFLLIEVRASTDDTKISAIFFWVSHPRISGKKNLLDPNRNIGVNHMNPA